MISKWRIEQGTQLEPTTIATSNQNGAAERNIQTCENSMRAMLKDAELPLEFWDEAVETDVYIRNRTQTGPFIEGLQISPEEAFTGLKPDIGHIAVWGSKCISYINPHTIAKGQRTDKLVDRGRVGVFMGYSDTTNKQLRVYSPELGYTSRTSRITIMEHIEGGTVDLRLRKCASGPQGTVNMFADRQPRGRPKFEMKETLVVTEPATIKPAAVEPDVVKPVESDVVKLDAVEPIVADLLVTEPRSIKSLVTKPTIPERSENEFPINKLQIDNLSDVNSTQIKPQVTTSQHSYLSGN